jgi:hypothetical protein
MKGVSAFLRITVGFATVVFATSLIWHAGYAQVRSIGHVEVSVKSGPDARTGAVALILDVLLVNDSNSPLFFTDQSSDWNYQLDITGPDGAPLKLTNWGQCVLPMPNEILRNILRKLDSGGKDHIESIVVNRLYRLDRVGRYHVIARRRVWPIKPAYAGLDIMAFVEKCKGLTVCTEQAESVSASQSFVVESPYPDVSPQADPGRCR